MVSLPYEGADAAQGILGRVLCRSRRKDSVSLYPPEKRVVSNRMPGPRDQSASFLWNGQYASRSSLIGVHGGTGERSPRTSSLSHECSFELGHGVVMELRKHSLIPLRRTALNFFECPYIWPHQTTRRIYIRASSNGKTCESARYSKLSRIHGPSFFKEVLGRPPNLIKV